MGLSQSAYSQPLQCAPLFSFLVYYIVKKILCKLFYAFSSILLVNSSTDSAFAANLNHFRKMTIFFSCIILCFNSSGTLSFSASNNRIFSTQFSVLPSVLLQVSLFQPMPPGIPLMHQMA